MKLERALVKGFGKLKGLEINFSPNMTLIFGENASGKTTLQRFIIAAIYGFPRKGKKIHPEQPHYLPWHGGSYGGSLRISFQDGSALEVSRDFSRGTGEGKVTDLRSGKELKPDTLLKKLGLDRKGFEAACVVRQMEIREVVESKEAREALRSALERLAGGPDATAGEAMNRLKKALKKVGEKDGHYNTERGRAWQERERCGEELKHAEEIHSSLEEILSQLAEVNREIKSAEERVCKARRDFLLAKERDLENKLEELGRMEEELQQAKEEKEKWKEFSEFPEERERELDNALVRRDEARKVVGKMGEEKRRSEEEWREAEEKLEQLKVVEDVLGTDPEKTLADAESRWKGALRAFKEAEREKEEAEEKENGLHKELKEVKAEVEKLRFVAELGPEPKVKLAGIKARWDQARERLKRAKEETEKEKQQIEELKREVRNLQKAARKRLIAGVISLFLGVSGTGIGLLGPKWFFSLSLLIALGGAFLVLGRKRLLRCKELLDEANRKEAEMKAKVREAEEELSRVEDDALRSLKAVGAIEEEEGEIREKHFEQAMDLISKWEEMQGKLTSLEERLREVREELSKARGEWELAKERLEEEEGRAKALLEGIGVLEKGKPPSPEAFEKARGKVEEWRRAKEKEEKKKALYEEACKKLNEARESLERAEADIQRILRDVGVESPEEFKLRANGRRKFEKWSREAEDLEGRIKALLSGRRKEDLKRELEVTRREREKLEGSKPELAGTPVPDKPLEELEREAKKAEDKVIELREKRKQLEGRLEELQDGPNLAEAKAKFEEAKERYREVKDFSEELKEALKALEEAADRFGSRWAERLSEEVNPLAKRILKGTYEEVKLLGDLSVKVRPTGQTNLMDPGILSTGEREQLFLLLRACAAKEMSRHGENLTLILDEPFAQVDENRRSEMWDFLLELSKTIQVIVFTCHKNHFEEAIAAAKEKRLCFERKREGEFEIASINWLAN